jgi:beta-lactamase regulating signal transducer with metallopeptidase domain
MLPGALFGDLGMMGPVVWAWCASAGEALWRTAGTTLVTSIWQSAVIVCGLEICLRLLPRTSAAHRFAVWAGGFAIATGLPLLVLVFRQGVNKTADSIGQSGVAGHSAGALLHLDARWGLAIAVLWVVAALIRAADLAVHSVRLRRLWKAARPVEVDARLASVLNGVRGGRVTICTTEMLDRPSVIGFFAPRILIPKWLMARLTPGELEQIVLHEAQHLERNDDWTNLVQKLALVAFPLNPALAWMEHRLCREREMACDEGVVRITKAPRAYAACLASLAERSLERSAEALSLGAWQKRSELVHRVHGILLRKPGLSRAAATAMLGTVGCALVAGSVEMARAPQLVAFVHEQKSEEMPAARQQELAALLARESAEAKMSLPEGYKAVQTRATVPDALRKTTATNSAKRQIRKNAILTADDQQIAKVNQVGDRVNPTSDGQWVVLSAWEEVRTVSQAPGARSDVVADYATNAVSDENAVAAQQKNGNPAGQGTGKALNQAGSGYTVTQLILRLAPVNPNSNSMQPAGSVRGWFVIHQL